MAGGQEERILWTQQKGKDVDDASHRTLGSSGKINDFSPCRSGTGTGQSGAVGEIVAASSVNSSSGT